MCGRFTLRTSPQEVAQAFDLGEAPEFRLRYDASPAQQVMAIRLDHLGLLVKPQRKPSGYRQYDESVIARLKFIRRTKELGITLGEIGGLLSLWFGGKSKCSQVRQQAEHKIADIEAKIATLQKMKRSLQKLIRVCHNRPSIEACPLLERLDSEGRLDSGS
jgi:DNA-binding transcriptional MerR regulator